jgi:hypothetical protein
MDLFQQYFGWKDMRRENLGPHARLGRPAKAARSATPAGAAATYLLSMAPRGLQRFVARGRWDDAAGLFQVENFGQIFQ